LWKGKYFSRIILKLNIFARSEMKNDMDSVIGRVCKFLDVELSQEKVEQLKEHLDFKNFKNNPAVNNE